MRGKLKKFINLVLIILFVFVAFQNTVFADDLEGGIDDAITSADNFIVAGKDETIDKKQLGDTSKYIYNILFTIAVVAAVVVGMVLGIQFIISGSEEQAKIKESLIPYVIGIFVVFGSFTIWKIVINLGNKVVGGTRNYSNRASNS